MAQARSVTRHGLAMREAFDISSFKLTSWFPRHMFKGYLQVQGKLHGVDAVIEVHDARIPCTGRNANLSDIGIIRPSLLVMNKVDLIDPNYVDAIKRYYKKNNQDVIFTNCKKSGDKGVKSIVPKILRKLNECNRYNRASNSEYNLLVLGIPNVGKSSLINSLRNYNMNRKKAALVAPIPGVTKCVMERIKIHRSPLVFVRDTPGVLAPRIPGAESGLRLALAAIVQEHLVGRRLMADYLLYWLNRHGRREYVQELQLPGPTDDIRQVLVAIAVRDKLFFTKRLQGADAAQQYTDYEMAADHFITMWRKGILGCAMLDGDVIGRI